jgi:nucleotide-binding universal stress UspA family protein
MAPQEIVVGTRGLGRLRAALGGVTMRLLHDPPCPVLVVPVGPGA